jgi:hypothetical protein
MAILWLGAAALLLGMLLLLLGSSWEDAFIYDEPPHITAGYAYLRFRDARLNPDNPPLLKMWAAVPLLALAPQFPLAALARQADPHEHWTTAQRFLYESGNEPHRIARLARLGPISVTLGLGLALFLWTRSLAGGTAALLALGCYAWSPTILAHGRYVTVDVSAALGVALAGAALSRFLQCPSLRAALVSGLTLALALLLKTSAVLLVPLMVALTLLWLGLDPRRMASYLRGVVIIGSTAALLVLFPYLWTTGRYPPAQQVRDTYLLLSDYAGGPLGRAEGATAEEDLARLQHDRTRDLRACVRQLAERRLPHLPRCAAELAIFLADEPLIRGWGAYLAGLVYNHWVARNGSIAYFRGEVSGSGWWSYFPVVYAIKEPLPFHLLTALALGLALTRAWSGTWGLRALITWLRSHAADTVMFGWLALYWSVALSSSLNIGIRHLLPVFPFTILLVARELSRWLTRRHRLYQGLFPSQGAKGLILISLLAWQGVSVVRVYPAFLAYFNEVAGGPAAGAQYVVDSNLDWGQDLRRLRAFIEAQGIETIAVDYFGTSSPRYELGTAFVPWHSALGPYRGWLAVSASILYEARGRWDPALWHRAEDSYAWLQGKSPVTTIGYSIVVFDLRDRKSDCSTPVSRLPCGDPVNVRVTSSRAEVKNRQ